MSYGYDYTKLFRQILDSTIWQEGMETKLVFVTMLADCDRFGRVLMSIPGLAKRSGASLTGCEKALGILLAPDPYSRTKDHEGRRIEEIDGGWRLFNHEKYRALKDEQAQRERHARNQATYRQRKCDRVTGHVTGSDPMHLQSASATPPATATASKTKKKRDAGASASSKRKPKQQREEMVRDNPPTVEEVRAYIEEKGLHIDPEEFHAKNTALGWVVGRGEKATPAVSWKGVAQTWECQWKRNQPEEESPDPEAVALIARLKAEARRD